MCLGWPAMVDKGWLYWGLCLLAVAWGRHLRCARSSACLASPATALPLRPDRLARYLVSDRQVRNMSSLGPQWR